jgi:DNA-binding MarR family transcriptional regulator
MSNATTSFQRLIGQTEKTLNAILIRLLSGAVSEPEWVALVLIAGSGGSAGADELTAQVARGLKSNQQTAAGHMASLAAKGLVLRSEPGPGTGVWLTDAGRRLMGDVQAQVGTLTQRLWGDLPAADMDVTSRVLSTVLERAEAELSAAS